MHYENISLRALFPALSTEPEDTLRAARAAYAASTNLPPRQAAYRAPTLTAYCPDIHPDKANASRPSVIICPGGGFSLVSTREAEPVALRLAAKGYNAFILWYSVAPVRHPAQLLELAAAVALVRSRAAEFHADPRQIAVLGFSAGGWLAAALGTMWKQPFLAQALHTEPQTLRPDAMGLGYAVLTTGVNAHAASFRNLLGERATSNERDALSLERLVSADTPPAFMWHTFDDAVVPVENALLFTQAMRNAQVSCELHIFPHGPHGLSLADAETAMPDYPQQINAHAAHWLCLFDEWLRGIFSAKPNDMGA